MSNSTSIPTSRPSPIQNWGKLKFMNWPLGAGSNSTAVLIDPHVKMSNFAEVNV